MGSTLHSISSESVLHYYVNVEISKKSGKDRFKSNDSSWTNTIRLIFASIQYNTKASHTNTTLPHAYNSGKPIRRIQTKCKC